MPAPVEFSGVHTSVLCEVVPLQARKRLFGIEIVCGELIWVDSGMPCVIAADSTNALNVEPAWKPLASPYLLGHHVVEVGLALLLVAAHRARLGERADLAGAGLDHGQAADGLVGRVHVVGARTSSAARWKRRSMVVLMVRPPLNSSRRRSSTVLPRLGSARRYWTA